MRYIVFLKSAIAPWAVMPLLMIGGAYLCYERNNRPNAANRAEETLRTSLWQSGTRRC
jgi:predicted DNA repair protein MutK